MPGEIKLGLRLTADAKGFVGEVRISKEELDKLRGGTDKAAAANRELSSSSRQVQAATKNASGSFIAAHGAMLRFAAALQQTTTFGDEEILEGQGILLSFANIAGESFARATEAALNLSAGLQQDLRSSVIQLGKALDDPVTGLDALSRSGTKFTDQQKDLIRSLAESGQVAQAQKVILDELEKQYGGAARAARDTLGGALAALGNTWGDLLEVETSATEGLRQRIEAYNTALGEIDVAELHADLADLGTVTKYIAGVYAVSLVPATYRWITAGVRARIATNGLSVAQTTLAARADVARLKMLGGAAAVTRFGRATRVAGRYVRLFGRGLAAFGGPLGLAVLAASAVYQFATANDRASESLKELPDDVDAFRESLEKLNAVQLKGRRIGVADQFEVAQEALEKAQKTQQTRARGLASGRGFRGPQGRTKALKAEALAAAAVEDAKAKVAKQQQRLDEIDAAIKKAISAVPATPPEVPVGPLDANTDKILQSLRTHERVIRDNYAAQIETIRKGGAALHLALQEEGTTQIEVIKQLQARRDSEITKLQLQESGLPAIIERADQGQAAASRARPPSLAEVEQQVNQAAPDLSSEASLDRAFSQAQAHGQRLLEAAKKQVQERLDIEISAARRGQALLAAQGKNVADIEQGLAAAAQADLEQLEAEHVERRLEIDRDYYERRAQLREQAQAFALAQARGYIDRDAEQTAEAVAAALEAQRGAADEKALVNADYADYAPRVAAVQKTIIDIEKTTGRARLQNQLKLGEQTFALAAGHSKKAFKAQQAFAIANAIISTYTGVAKEAAKGFPIGLITGAIVLAAGLAQVAAIRSQQPPSGFALGGIIEGPVRFTARNVPNGLAGEAGPEAILPLRRGPGGRLGVETSGGGRAQQNYHQEVNLTLSVQALDAVGVDEILEQRGPMFARLVREELAEEGRTL